MVITRMYDKYDNPFHSVLNLTLRLLSNWVALCSSI